MYFNEDYNTISKNLKKYPGIAEYLELKHPDVYQLFIDTGMVIYLAPRKQGKTFLLPDKKTVGGLQKTVLTNDIEKVTEALSSFIIDDYIPNLSTLEQKKQDIPTLLGKKLLIKTVNKDSATLINNTVIKPLKDYVPLESQGKWKKGHTAIWEINGLVPISDDVPDATYEFVKKKKKGGAATNEMRNMSSFRKRLTLNVEKQFIDFLNKKRMTDPYINVISNFIDFAKGDDTLLGIIKIALADCAVHIGFYNLFEPNINTIYPLVKDETIGQFMRDYNNGMMKANRASSNIKKFYTTPFGKNKALSNNPTKISLVQKKIKEVRKTVFSNPGMEKTTRKISNIYNNLETKNSINGLTNIYPKESIKLVAMEKNRLGTIHENAFLFESKFQKIIKTRNIQIQEPIKEYLNIISCITSKQTSPFNKQFVFGNVGYVKSLSGGPAWFASGPGMFIRSSSFIAVPIKLSKTRGGDDKFDESTMHPLSNKFIDYSKKNLLYLGNDNDKEFELSESALKELQMYKKYHNKNPRF
jgi:hypothetical protein